MIDGHDLELFERSLRHATESHTGPALDAALADLGWGDALSVDPRAAVSRLFTLQGEANAVSSALDQVLAHTLGHEAPAALLPMPGQWTAPATRDGDRLTVHGIATARLGGQLGLDGAATTSPDGELAHHGSGTASSGRRPDRPGPSAAGPGIGVDDPDLAAAEPGGQAIGTGSEGHQPDVAAVGDGEHGRVLVVARAGEGHVAVEVDGALLTRRAVEGLDPSLGLVEVRGVVGDVRELGAVDWREAVALGQLALGHELVGAARRMLELAREHALERVQFGRPIAMFQAVRHRLAETLLAIEAADAALDAAWADQDPQAAAMGKASAGRAARVAARHCQQVLAGIGFTTEHPFHRYVKRALALEQLLGSTRDLTRQLGRDIVEQKRLPALLPL